MSAHKPSVAALTVLGFDVGSKYIGVAVGQTITSTANPLETLMVRNGKPDWARIETLIRTWQPQVAIIGEPLNMDDSEQRMTATARKFGRQIHGRFGVTVEMMDERLSTVEARSRLHEAGTLHRQADHPVAAQVIVESWLTARSADASN
jgi:putative holliday junction resolvase